MDAEQITIWTIYDHPADYPHHFVVRSWRVAEADGCSCVVVLVPGVGYIANTLDEAREKIPPGLSNVERMADDDGVVVESWL